MNKYERFAASQFLTYFPDNISFEELTQLILDHSEDVVVWEPFENDCGSTVVEWIEDLAAEALRVFGTEEPLL